MQVRDVPDAVRLALQREAEARGQSLQAFLLEVLEREARNVRNRQAARTDQPLRLKGIGPVDVVGLVEQGHDERDRQIMEAAVGASEADAAIEQSSAVDDRR